MGDAGNLRTRSWLKGARFLADRAAVLFIGVGVGVTISLAFLGHGYLSDAAAPGPPSAPGGVARAAPRLSPATAPCDCDSPFPPRMLSRIAAGQPVTIGVFGDSFGDGFWAALYRRLGKENVKVLRLSHEGVGFTRYQTTNLEEKAARQLAEEPVDLAVISIGANDTQGLWDGPHAYMFLTPHWKDTYGGRIDRFVTLIRNQGAMIYWVGLPRMREPRYDKDIMALNALDAQRMAALNVPYLSTRELSVDDRGMFNPYLLAPGAKESKQMRTNDGVHMTIPGYELLAGPLITRIQAYLASARVAAKTPGSPS